MPSNLPLGRRCLNVFGFIFKVLPGVLFAFSTLFSEMLTGAVASVRSTNNGVVVAVVVVDNYALHSDNLQEDKELVDVVNNFVA